MNTMTPNLWKSSNTNTNTNTNTSNTSNNNTIVYNTTTY